MSDIKVEKSGFKIIEEIKIPGKKSLPAGTVLKDSEISECGLRFTNKVLDDIVKVEIKDLSKLYEQRDLSDCEHLEVTVISEPYLDIMHVNHNIEMMGGIDGFMPPPMKTRAGIRDKRTGKLVVPMEYSSLDIINADLVLVNDWLLVGMRYLDGTVRLNNGHVQTLAHPDYNDPSDVIYKIAHGEYPLVRPYMHEDKMYFYLVKAEPVYNVTLGNVTRDDLEGLRLPSEVLTDEAFDNADLVVQGGRGRVRVRK